MTKPAPWLTMKLQPNGGCGPLTTAPLFDPFSPARLRGSRKAPTTDTAKMAPTASSLHVAYFMRVLLDNQVSIQPYICWTSERKRAANCNYAVNGAARTLASAQKAWPASSGRREAGPPLQSTDAQG